MSLARLVLHVSHENLLVGEAGGKLFGTGYHAAAIVAYVDDESVAGHEVSHYVVEVAFAEFVGKATAVDISYVVVEDAIAHARSYLVVGAEIFS